MDKLSTLKHVRVCVCARLRARVRLRVRLRLRVCVCVCVYESVCVCVCDRSFCLHHVATAFCSLAIIRIHSTGDGPISSHQCDLAGTPIEQGQPRMTSCHVLLLGSRGSSLNLFAAVCNILGIPIIRIRLAESRVLEGHEALEIPC